MREFNAVSKFLSDHQIVIDTAMTLWPSAVTPVTGSWQHVRPHVRHLARMLEVCRAVLGERKVTMMLLRSGTRPRQGERRVAGALASGDPRQRALLLCSLHVVSHDEHDLSGFKNCGPSYA